jgi:hypothetical protein
MCISVKNEDFLMMILFRFNLKNIFTNFQPAHKIK